MLIGYILFETGWKFNSRKRQIQWKNDGVAQVRSVDFVSTPLIMHPTLFTE